MRGFRTTTAAWCTTATVAPPTSRPAAPRRVPVVIHEDDLEEKFSRGGGPGGQSVNKARNKVQLRHVPTGITVQVHEQRDLTTNRSIARKLLKDKIDLLLNGDISRMGQRAMRAKRRKGKAASRARKKYGDSSNGAARGNEVGKGAGGNEEVVEDDDDDDDEEDDDGDDNEEDDEEDEKRDGGMDTPPQTREVI